MTDSTLDKAADKLQQKVDDLAAQGGVKAKVADALADDPEFIRKLKPSLMVARAKGEAPTNESPAHGRAAPPGPQVRERPKPSKRRSGGPSPWLVAALALAVGIVAAKVLDWRGHAHPRD
jgi:hypothetical protein